jgi:hypothetical protein
MRGSRSWIFVGLAVCQILASACASGRAVLQVDGGAIYVTDVYSSNERFYLRATGCGRTPVFEVGRVEPRYVIGDSMDQMWGRTFLSADGRVVVYFNFWEPQEGISIYVEGRLANHLSSAEVTRCDPRRERCHLVYSNDDDVIDRARSTDAPDGYHKVFRAGVSEQERFLNEHAFFSAGDAVFLVDSRKRVHRISLADGTVAEPVAFEDIYSTITLLPQTVKTEEKSYPAPDYSPSSLVVRGGQPADEVLARRLHMKTLALPVDPQFKEHVFLVSGTLQRDGHFEVAELKMFGDFKKDELSAFFATTRFDTHLIPPPCDWWYLENQAFSFRHPNKDIARREQRAYLAAQEKERQERLVAERIQGIYIPKDLGECFGELDKMLSEESRKEMEGLSKREEMLRYHHGLGTGLRNRWGLWGASRLQKYFIDGAVQHPDDMSAIILDYYYDWLHGDRESWKNWRSQWRVRLPQPPTPAAAPAKVVK